MMMRRLMLLALIALVLTAACAKVSQMTTEIAADQGLISQDQKRAIDRTSEAFRKSFEDLTEEEEYYLGRAVAASILSRYPIHDDPELTGYVNRVGQAVVLASDRPEIYNGYHFAVLDTDEINAFAAPGGFIFVTRGLLALTPDEDALAGVLGHEVSHIAVRHGLASIRKSRLVDAFAILGQEAGKELGQQDILKLTEIFEGAVGDIVRTLVESGYDRAQEREADRMAIAFASGIGYGPDGLGRFLEAMAGQESSGGGLGVLRSHPMSEDRLEAAREALAAHVGEGTDPQPRQARFRTHLAQLRE